MTAVGYIAFVVLGFTMPLFLIPFVPLIALVGFPGIGGVMMGIAASIALSIVRLFAPVNPWICFAIFAVEQFAIMPQLVNAKQQVPFALITFGLVIVIFL